jgi:hypothetical protein
MKIPRLFLLACVVLTSGSCLAPPRKQPFYPQGVSLGWREDATGKLSGSFVLVAGEPTEYAGIRISVTRIIDNNRRIQWETRAALAFLRFTDISEPENVCDAIAFERAKFKFGSECNWLKQRGVGGINPKAINSRDNWVYFDLTQ